MLKAVKTEERGILQFFYSLIKLQKKKKEKKKLFSTFTLWGSVEFWVQNKI